MPARRAQEKSQQKRTAQAASAKRSPPGSEPDADAIAAARALYDAGAASIAAICDHLGLTRARFDRLRREQGWPPRPSPIRRRGDPPAPPAGSVAAPGPAAAPDAPCDLRALGQRVGAAIEHQLSEVEGRLGDTDVGAAERNARILSSLVKSLGELRRFDEPARGAARSRDRSAMQDNVQDNMQDKRDDAGAAGNDDDAQPPRNLAELREELARKLAQLRAEQHEP